MLMHFLSRFLRFPALFLVILSVFSIKSDLNVKAQPNSSYEGIIENSSSNISEIDSLPEKNPKELENEKEKVIDPFAGQFNFEPGSEKANEFFSHSGGKSWFFDDFGDFDDFDDGEKYQFEDIAFTTISGRKVKDPYHSLSAGLYVLLTDNIFHQIIGHFNRERLPERVAFARGASAYGHFICTVPSLDQYTILKPFSSVGKKTPIAVRFSTMSSGSGSADLRFDLRGFAMRFYTPKGLWDLMMLSSNAFYIRDPIKYPDLMHALRNSPKNNVYDPDRLFDFMINYPESVNAFLRQFAGAGTTLGYIPMNGYSINTFITKDKYGKYRFVRFQAKTKLPLSLSIVELNLLTIDRDWASKQLYEAIKNKNYPKWDLEMQLMTLEQAKTLDWNPLDATKAWDELVYIPIKVGEIILDQNPVNFFIDNQQIAFSVSNMIHGIYPSQDKLLQGQYFAYSDAQNYRLGANYNLFKPNRPIYQQPFLPNSRDGFGQCGWNYGKLADYIPNSKFKKISKKKKGKKVLKIRKSSIFNFVTRVNDDGDDNFSQPSAWWKTLSEESQALLVVNLGKYLALASNSYREKVLELLLNVDPELVIRLTVDSTFQDIITPSENDLELPEDSTIWPTNLGVPLDVKNPSSMIEYFDTNSIRPPGWGK
ncbi:catalase-like [Brevipalpus obovatus]|uniref:catalase-like n=1 Tax=Brevipalpus obovatus TaxID=246614 RepID=UPI003D9EEB2E